MKGQIILLIILFIYLFIIIIIIIIIILFFIYSFFNPLSEKIDVVHSWEESVEKPNLSISPTPLLKGQVHGSAHAHLSNCCFSAGTCCIVYASNMITS